MDLIETTVQITSNIKEGIQIWLAHNTPEKIKEQVSNELERNKKTIMYKLMGFNNNWDRWEMRHCNKNASAGAYLNAHAKEAITEWLGQVELPPMSQKIMKDLTKHYEAELRFELSHRVKRELENRLTAQATEIVDGLYAKQTAALNNEEHINNLLNMDYKV